MPGMVFFATRQIEHLKEFYVRSVGCTVWLDQQDCVILAYDGFRVGFCQRDRVDLDGMICFVFTSKDAVDEKYYDLQGSAKNIPTHNSKYKIYHFFATDPDGRTLEFQTFDDPELNS